MSNSPQLKPPPFKTGAAPDLYTMALLKVDLMAQPNFVGHGKGSPVAVGYGMQVIRALPGEGRRRQVQLQCTLGSGQAPEQIPYAGTILVMAEFRFKDVVELGEEEMDQRAAWLAANTLVGMIRTHLLTLTAIMPYPPVMLSPVVPLRILAKATVIESMDAGPRAMYPEHASVPALNNSSSPIPAKTSIVKVKRVAVRKALSGKKKPAK